MSYTNLDDTSDNSPRAFSCLFYHAVFAALWLNALASDDGAVLPIIHLL